MSARGFGLSVSVYWEGEGGRHNAATHDVDSFVAIEVVTYDVPSVIVTLHYAAFACNENPDGGCEFLFTTATK